MFKRLRLNPLRYRPDISPYLYLIRFTEKFQEILFPLCLRCKTQPVFKSLTVNPSKWVKFCVTPSKPISDSHLPPFFRYCFIDVSLFGYFWSSHISPIPAHFYTIPSSFIFCPPFSPVFSIPVIIQQKFVFSIPNCKRWKE